MMWEVQLDSDAVTDLIRSRTGIRLNQRFETILNHLDELCNDCEAASLQDSARDITRAILVARGFYSTEEEEGN